MEKDLAKLWKTTLGILGSKISQGNFVALFKPTTLLSLEDDIATIAAPSPMVINLIEKKFIPVVEESLSAQLGRDISILFVVKSVRESKILNEENAPLFVVSENPKPITIGHLPRVRQDFTFQTIAVSGSNQLAFISATTVAKNIGKTYNPLFIYGPVGVGKTHLMQAIANDVYQKDPSKKIIYITSEEFTNEVVEAIRTNQTHAMKKRFRNAYLLMIDDVQFIAGKDKVQEELFHTFNILIDNGSQIVLSSDRPPHEIKKLEQRLSSRFSGGLTVDIEPPDFELKTAILMIKAKKFGVELPIEVAKTIAEGVGDIRSLEGALLRTITQASSQGSDITNDFATKALNKREESTHYHPDDIIKQVCTFYNIKSTQIKGPKRDASLVRARQVAMYLLKKELGLTLVEIGNMLGGRDHTTVMYGVDKVEQQLSSKAKLSEDIMGITRTLRE